MKFPKHVWDQLKGKTCEGIIAALEKDDFYLDTTRGAQRAYKRNADGRRVTIHCHPGKTYGPKLPKALIEDIGWAEEDMRRLKLVK